MDTVGEDGNWCNTKSVSLAGHVGETPKIT